MFLDRGEGEEKERERSMCGCLSCTPYWGPGQQASHLPDCKLNPLRYGSQAGAQSEPHQPGLKIYFLKRFYLLIFRGRGREEGERERNIDMWEIHPWVASRTPPTGDLAGNLGMCPNWESNGWPFSSQAGTQSTEPHQPGQKNNLFLFFKERKRNINLLFHSFMHSLVDSCRCLWPGIEPKPWCMGHSPTNRATRPGPDPFT